MPVNPYVEGNPSPCVISVVLPRDFVYFAELRDAMAALGALDRYLRQDWYKLFPATATRRHREVVILGLRKDSPLGFSILTDPAWLTVFLSLVAYYPQLKTGAAEIASDVNHVLETVAGLTNSQEELLESSIRLTIAKWASLTGRAARQVARLAERIQAIALATESSDTRESPEITVRDIDTRPAVLVRKGQSHRRRGRRG